MSGRAEMLPEGKTVMEAYHTSPLVTVIMPSYNTGAYLEDAIASVAAQTYQNWELLVLDDCSTDGSLQIAESWSRRDPRIRLLPNPQNMGVARTRNRGLELASGEWVALLDSDDIWRPEKLARQLECAGKTGAELLYASYSMFETGKPGRAYTVPSSVNYSQLLIENVIGCSTVMIKRSALGAHRFKQGFYHEDYALWLELLRSGLQAAGCTEVLVNWRVLRDSRSFDKKRAAKNRWMIYRKAEHLSMLRSARAFAAYAIRGLIKHKRL